MKNLVATAEKRFDTQLKKWQYITSEGQVLITCRTERQLELNWTKYKKAWDL